MSNEVLNPYQTFRDSTGAVVENGTLTFNVNETSTLDTIYSDEALTIAQDNPYTLDAAGRMTGDVRYRGKKRMILKDQSGATIRTLDHVVTASDLSTFSENYATLALAAAAITAADVGKTVTTTEHTADYGYEGGNTYLVQAATSGWDNGSKIRGTTDTSVELLALFPNGYNVKHWGAGTSAAASVNSAAFAAAFALHALGQTLWVPRGTYLVSEAVKPARGWNLKGDGRLASIIKRTDTVAETLDSVSTTAILYIGDTWIDVEDLSLESNDSAVDGIAFSNAGPTSHCNFKRMDINNLRTAVTETAGLFLTSFEDVNVSSSVNGWALNANTDKTTISLLNCYTSACTGQPYDFFKVVYSTLTGCASDADNSANQDTEKGVYNFEICNLTLNGCGTEGSYGNGSVRVVSSTVTINNFVSSGGRSTFEPDYATYTNFGVGPVQTSTTFNTLNINGMTVSDWENTYVTASFPSKPVADLVSFNYDGTAADFLMVNVGASNVSPGNMFAGHGSASLYCANQHSITKPTMFGAYASGATSLTTATFTKVDLATEELDSRGVFASSRFTPNIPGYYQVNFSVSFSGTVTRGFTSLYKNGSEYKRGSDVTAATVQSTGSTWVYLDGLTDYIELYCYATGSSLAAAAGQAFTFLNGHFLRS